MKRGFVGLSLVGLLALAPFAAADKPSAPPGQAKKAEPEAEARGNEAPESPPAEQPAPPAEPQPEAQDEPASEQRARVRIRSVSSPPAPPAPEQADPVEPEQADEAPARERVDRRAPATGTFHPAAASPPAAAAAATPALIATASSPQPDKPASSREADAPPAAPRESLPERVFPRQVSRIAQVVPMEVWGVLAALALLALVFGAASWITATRARRLRRQRAELLDEVGLLQAALLPAVPPDAPVSVAYRPADGAAAGGDFYDAFTLADGRTGIILGDVSGHGRDALARTTFVRYTLRAYLEAGLEPREVLKVGAAALADHLDGGFATVTVAIHDPITGRFIYASAGHPPPIVTGADEPFEAVTACSAPPLGIDEMTGFRQSAFNLTTGARACLHTDGLIEARMNGRLLGAARLERAVAALPPDAGAEELLDAVAQMADEIPDDMAACLVTAAPDTPAAGPRIEELEVDERDVGDSLERFLRACGVTLSDVPGILREAGEAARREGFATVRVRMGDPRPGVDVVPGNIAHLGERRGAARFG